MWTTSFGHSIKRNQHRIKLRSRIGSAVSFVLNQVQKYNIRDIIIIGRHFLYKTGDFFLKRKKNLSSVPMIKKSWQKIQDDGHWLSRSVACSREGFGCLLHICFSRAAFQKPLLPCCYLGNGVDVRDVYYKEGGCAVSASSWPLPDYRNI